MSEVVVVGSAEAQPGREDELAQALRTNADASRREAGCIESHMGTPHVQTLLHTITPMLAAPPDIQVLEEL